MKTKTIIKLMKEFAKDESKEIQSFITRFERSLKVSNGFHIPHKFDKKTYQAYLNSKTWKAIKKEVLDLKGKYCEGCGSSKKIHVHHSSYDKKVLTGRNLAPLKVVCEECHFKIHKLVDEGMMLSTATNKVLREGKVGYFKNKHADDLAFFKNMKI